MQAALVRYHRRRARADGGSRPGDCVGKVDVSEANRDGFEGERPSPWNPELRHNGFLERTKAAMEGSIRKRAGAVGNAEVLERNGDGVHQRERGLLPQGRRLCRELHGVGRVLARLPVVAEVARAARRSHVHRRQGRRRGRLDRRGVPRGQIPAPHRALLPQRAGQGPQIEAFAGRCQSSRAWRWPLPQVESLRSVAAHQPVMLGRTESASSRASPNS